MGIEPTAHVPRAVLRPVDCARLAWAALPLGQRLKVIRNLRHLIAEDVLRLTEAIPSDLARNHADTQAAEILPLLAAAKFLEREAHKLLAVRHLGRRGLPFWLAGVHSSVKRVPMGSVLIIAPANYPLFLPGVQALQALAAGNTVVWKPGRNGAPVAHLFAELATRAGVPTGVLRIADESVEAATLEIAALPDKIIFTGSSSAGRAVLRQAAEHAIPVVAELSGCDAVFALPSADPDRLVAALSFGMRLNGSATCMAPRRLILIGDGHDALLARVKESFAAADPIFIRESVRRQLIPLLNDARAHGASILGDLGPVSMRPILILNGTATMQIARADLFAPVLTVLRADNESAALHVDAHNSYGLTAAIFGDESLALAFGRSLTVGTLLINDLIVPTADPRVPFGGRGASGFGTTRGAEGLLEMTAARAILVRRGRGRRHLEPTSSTHEDLFGGLIALIHSASFSSRFAGLKRMFAAAKKLK